jgi:hypothetical protein
MTIYTDIRDAVFGWTNRPLMTAETDLAIGRAVRAAHKQGAFYRDLVITNVTGLALDAVQQIDLSTTIPLYRQIAMVKPTDVELRYNPAEITDLFDQDNYYKRDIYYGVGNYLMVRANTPVADLDIYSYNYPVTSPIASLTSWIAELHQDLIVLEATATVLTMIGEQEIKERVQLLAREALQDLIDDSATMVRR